MLVIELTASGADVAGEVKLWVQTGDGAETATGKSDGAAWARRTFAKDVAIRTEAACAAKALGADGLTFTITEIWGGHRDAEFWQIDLLSGGPIISQA